MTKAAAQEPNHIDRAIFGPRSLIITPTVAIQGTNSVITIIAVTACTGVSATSVSPKEAKSLLTMPRIKVVAMRGSLGKCNHETVTGCRNLMNRSNKPSIWAMVTAKPAMKNIGVASCKKLTDLDHVFFKTLSYLGIRI